MTIKYDVHTHIGLDPGFYLRGWWPYASTAHDLLQQMDAHGIDRAVCFPFTLPSAFDSYAFAHDNAIKLLPSRFPFDRENALLTGEIERLNSQDRLLQFAMFDSARCVSEQVNAIQGMLPKIRGLKTQSTVLRSPISALLNEGRPLMELAKQHDLPVLFHTSVNDPWAQVSDCLVVARAFPEVRFNLAHSLRFHAPLLREAAALANVSVDCSAHLAQCQLARENSLAVAPLADRVQADYSQPVKVLEKISEMLNGKYMWGSDNPFMSWCDDRLRILFSYRQEMQVVRELPQAIQQSMLSVAPRGWLFGAREHA